MNKDEFDQATDELEAALLALVGNQPAWALAVAARLVGRPHHVGLHSCGEGDLQDIECKASELGLRDGEYRCEISREKN